MNINSQILYYIEKSPELQNPIPKLLQTELAPLAIEDFSSKKAFALKASPEAKLIIINIDIIQKKELKNLVDNYKIRTQNHFIFFSKSQQQISKFILSNFTLINTLNNLSISKIKDDIALLNQALKGLSKLNQSIQEKNKMKLFKEQNDQLQLFSKKLEKKILSKKNQILKSKKRVIKAIENTKVLIEILNAISHSFSISELEANLLNSLKKYFNINWLKICLKNQDNYSNFKEKTNDTNIVNFPLSKGLKKIGSVYFSSNKKLLRNEFIFLEEISDLLGIAVIKLIQIKNSEYMKLQWEATFDAISSPVALIDKNYNIRRANKNFAIKSNSPIAEIINKKCYQQLYGRSSPCINCKLGSNFQIRQNDTTKKSQNIVDVFGQKLQINHNQMFLHLYHDISKRLLLEKQILDFSKTTEMGTIASSIAHEINNPLGAIINFIQLIKMDLKGDEVFFEEIQHLEDGALKCKHLVRNLLGFSRKADLDENTKVNILDAIEQAQKIIELRSKTLGIKIIKNLPEKEIFVLGNFNLLAQAIKNILQNSSDILLTSSSTKNRIIHLELSKHQDDCIINIKVNCGSKKRYNKLVNNEQDFSLGLTISRQIIEEHNGDLSIIEDENYLLYSFHIPSVQNI